MLSSSMLIMDRLVGTQFFNKAEGGDALLWQHMFWFFGHPEVYIIFLPATGFVSSIIPVFARRPIFGYTALVLALFATAILGFGLWVHHMFATNLPHLGNSFYTAVRDAAAVRHRLHRGLRAGRVERDHPGFGAAGPAGP
jgi:cytochrome c oxidase subunit I+III